MFADPRYAYFASDNPAVEYYWLMNQNEMKSEKVKSHYPGILSSELEQTGYYVMRDGWDENALQMVFSAGLSEVKPDHQHGDMLGVTAFGLGTELLPNYQVAYKYDDFPFWKNSWTKNVAIVDSQLQGREWKPNQGGSGFGKWKVLPKPSVKLWIKNDKFDYIAATHDGFDNLGVKYTREIVFIKDQYWLVFDNFISKEPHEYQQIWQGSYDVNSESEVFKTINENSRFFISQLNTDKFRISKSSFRDKSNLVFSIDKNGSYQFITLLCPVNNLEQKPENLFSTDNILSDWNLEIQANKILKANEGYLLLDAVKIYFAKKVIKLDETAHLFVMIKNEQLEMSLLNSDKVNYEVFDNSSRVYEKVEWIPGEKKSIVLDKRS
jgi:hypothetical protein